MDLHWFFGERLEQQWRPEYFEVGVNNDDDNDGFPSGSDSDDSNPTVAANCDPGNYGRFSCRAATPGYYVSGSGSTVMTPASPGHYVDVNGATSETQCPIGKFQELSGQTSCEEARPGYYVPGLGASEGTPCPVGKYNNQYGMTSIWLVSGQKPVIASQF